MGLFLQPNEKRIFAVNLAYLAGFGGYAYMRGNLEFLFYCSIIVLITAWILYKQHVIRFDAVVLWGLTFWGFLHMAGGTIPVGKGVLYGVQLIPAVLRYDQFVHAFGFGVATLACAHILRGYLRPDAPRTFTLFLLLVLIACGIGAINEIIEFIAVKTFPQTGVGGYENTMWDLVFNLLGSAVASAWLVWRPRPNDGASR